MRNTENLLSTDETIQAIDAAIEQLYMMWCIRSAVGQDTTEVELYARGLDDQRDDLEELDEEPIKKKRKKKKNSRNGYKILSPLYISEYVGGETLEWNTYLGKYVLKVK